MVSFLRSHLCDFPSPIARGKTSVDRGRAWGHEIQKRHDTGRIREPDFFGNVLSANIAPVFGFSLTVRCKLGVELLVAIGRPAKRNPKSKSQTRVNK